MELDMSINNNKEKFFDGLVDDKMKSFLKKFIFPQNSTASRKILNKAHLTLFLKNTK
jgi:hypothetical protein